MPTKQFIRDELRAIFAKAKMPTNPAVASAILKLSASDKSDVADFADVIRTDPSLALRVLRTANSAQFAQRTQVTNIERAVILLGLARVKATVLGFQLIAHLDRLGGVPFDLKSFWQHSLLRGCLARVIARATLPQRADEAFLIGLLQDCGTLLLVQVLGASYATLFRSDLSPAAFYATERETFPYSHVDAIQVMAGEWRLPLLIAVPMQRHHEPPRRGCDTPSEQAQLAAIAYFVGNVHFSGNLQITRDEPGLRDFATAALGLDQKPWAEIQRQTEAEYGSLLGLFGDLVPDDVDVGELLGEANRQLAEAAEGSETRVVDVEAQREALARQHKQLQSALRDYRERAALDPLTNILNRGGITEAARAAITRTLDECVPLGALFLDIDDFKRLNDRHGHDVGDKVLRSVAALLAKELQGRGTVGRYGGEEFVVVLPSVSADSTRAIGEEIVQAVRGLDPATPKCTERVTCSVGAVWSDRLPFNSAEELFAAADRLMYRAKKTGKNRCCFEILAPADEDASGGPRTGGGSTVGSSTEGRPAQRPQPVTIEEILAVARRLNELEVDSFAGIRKQPRQQLVVPCTLHYFTGAGSTLGAEPGATRNLSTGGVGLLVARPMIRGEPVEVVLNRSGSKLFLAGLVSFCRYLEGTLHEIGVQFVSHSVGPILSADPAEALSKHEWVNRAYTAKVTGRLQAALAT